MKVLIQYLDNSVNPIPRIRNKYVVLKDSEVKKFLNLIKKYHKIIISVQVLEK